MNVKVTDLLQEIADEVDGTLTTTYSGRGMMGKECVGITCDNMIECVEQAAIRGIFGARYDSMGYSYIVYWPKYTGESEFWRIL